MNSICDDTFTYMKPIAQSTILQIQFKFYKGNQEYSEVV